MASHRRQFQRRSSPSSYRQFPRSGCPQRRNSIHVSPRFNQDRRYRHIVSIRRLVKRRCSPNVLRIHVSPRFNQERRYRRIVSIRRLVKRRCSSNVLRIHVSPRFNQRPHRIHVAVPYRPVQWQHGRLHPYRLRGTSIYELLFLRRPAARQIGDAIQRLDFLSGRRCRDYSGGSWQKKRNRLAAAAIMLFHIYM